MLDRRGFLRAGLAVAAAPFIVRAGSLMALPERIAMVEILPAPQIGEDFAAFLYYFHRKIYTELYSDMLIYGLHARDKSLDRIDPMHVINGAVIAPHIFPARA